MIIKDVHTCGITPCKFCWYSRWIKLPTSAFRQVDHKSWHINIGNTSSHFYDFYNPIIRCYFCCWERAADPRLVFVRNSGEIWRKCNLNLSVLIFATFFDYYSIYACATETYPYVEKNVTTFDGFRSLISVLGWILLINKNVNTSAEHFKNSPQE